LLFNKFKIIKYMFKEKKKLMYKERKLVNCILTLKKTNNNFFIIISDMKNKVLAYRWAGQLNETHNVKNKRSFFLIFPLARYVIKILKKFNISRLSIRILSNVTSNMYKLVQLIQDSNIKIDRIYFRKPVPHHLGKKKKKLRRI
jgi:ribosomal protein S11